MLSKRRAARSPCLSSGERLGDVLAAIQVAATYKFYQLKFDGSEGWGLRITGDEANSERIKTVFAEHPEFFRIDGGGNGALVWRRQHQKLFDVDGEGEISRQAFGKLSEEKQARVSRAPLAPPEIATLMDAAIELHAGALERQRASRWWVTPATAFGGALVGGLIGLIN